MEKRGLGRGLAALISDTMSGEGEAQVRDIPLEQVTPNPYQPRTLFEPEKMQELVASIKEHGVLQPVLLRQIGHEQYQLVAGERRFRASQMAELTTIPALIKECSEKELLEMAVVENIQREDIGPMEAARAYRRLMDEFGMTQEMVAQRVGKSRPSVGNTVRLLDLPEEVQDSVERGEISEGHARALLSAKEKVLLLDAWRTVCKKRLSVRDTENLMNEIHSGDSGPGAKATSLAALAGAGKGKPAQEAASWASDPNVAFLTDRLQEVLGTKVIIRRTSGAVGHIEIEYYSSADLERLADLLTYGRYGE
jgi:ParB family chromosome partitioning protein